MSEFQTSYTVCPRRLFDRPRQGQKPILDVRELGIDFGGLTAWMAST